MSCGPIQLEKELPRYGCEIDPKEFREIILELKAVMTPHWTSEELLYHMDDVRQYVNAVRCRTQCVGLPDFLVLRTLINIRKRGRSA